MIDVKRAGAYYCDGKFKSLGEIRSVFTDKEISEAFKGTMAYSVLSAHSAYGAYRGDNRVARHHVRRDYSECESKRAEKVSAPLRSDELS